MSAATIANLAADLLTPVLFASPVRSIGGFVAQVTVKEEHADRTTITDHPVEQGAPITDHAYNQPAELVIEAAWSNASAEAGFDPGYVNTIYQQLLALKASRQPFSVTTAKRSYTNMLFAALSTTSDVETDTTLRIHAMLREVIIVQTQVTTVPPTAVQAQPQKTGGVSQAGQVQPLPTTYAPTI